MSRGRIKWKGLRTKEQKPADVAFSHALTCHSTLQVKGTRLASPEEGVPLVWPLAEERAIDAIVRHCLSLTVDALMSWNCLLFPVQVCAAMRKGWWIVSRDTMRRRWPQLSRASRVGRGDISITWWGAPRYQSKSSTGTRLARTHWVQIQFSILIITCQLGVWRSHNRLDQVQLIPLNVPMKKDEPSDSDDANKRTGREEKTKSWPLLAHLIFWRSTLNIAIRKKVSVDNTRSACNTKCCTWDLQWVSVVDTLTRRLQSVIRQWHNCPRLFIRPLM